MLAGLGIARAFKQESREAVSGYIWAKCADIRSASMVSRLCESPDRVRRLHAM